MEFVSRLTTKTDPDEIVADLTAQQPGEFDLGILFLSANNFSVVQHISGQLSQKLKIKTLIGCTGMGIIGNDAEIEQKNATVLILARLPGVKVIPYALTQVQLEGLKTADDWYRFFEVYPNEKPVFLTLPDPFTLDAYVFLEGLNSAYPRCPVVGGLASAGVSAGENTLIINEEYLNEGVVGVVLTGDVQVETIVSQGCHPVGSTYIITQAEGNLIMSLAGRPFMEVLEEVLDKLPEREQRLAEEAVFVGIAMDEYKHELKRGDFLIRGLMGVDRDTGAGVVADYVKPGQTVQFHIRDSRSAHDDLNELLISQQSKRLNQKPKGALVFCCNGRGEHLFREKNHDISAIQRHIGPVPAAGFFCAGEIGPVGKANFLHGFTNSIVLFYPAKN